jgi:hypothetical protein
LLEALESGVCFLDGEMGVRNCGFYLNHTPHLRIVRDDDDR